MMTNPNQMIPGDTSQTAQDNVYDVNVPNQIHES